MPQEVWTALGIHELVCTVGLIVPAVLHWQPALTVVPATVLAIESLVFVWVHAKYREITAIIFSGLLGLLMAFITYGRTILKPIFLNGGRRLSDGSRDFTGDPPNIPVAVPCACVRLISRRRHTCNGGRCQAAPAGFWLVAELLRGVAWISWLLIAKALAAPPGKVGTTIRILGSNLTRTTSVTVNGFAAKFTVTNSTEITATVPAGATNGPAHVTTPSGVLLSNVPFRVM